MPTSHQAELKLVTVLFADLVGHTEILGRVNSEEWQSLLDAYYAEMSRRIERYGGTVEKFIGDAIFAVFGVPRSHEDDAERAVRAAVEMLDALMGLNLVFQRRLGTSLGLRIAAATGEVVAPSEAQGGQFVTGELAALVERLQKEAPTNSIILGERTHRLVASLVEGEPLGPLALKGFPGGQRAFLVRCLRPGVQKPRSVEVSAPLVGREREMEGLLRARDRLLAEQGQVVVIVGEAGLGKSRLVAELRARLAERITFLEARCYEFMQTTAYGVVVEHLRGYLGLAGDDPSAVGRVQLGAALHRAFGSIPADIRQALEYLLGLDTSRDFEASVQGLGPEQVRSQIVRAIVNFWEAVAAKGPVLLVVEDLHWVDSASAGVLGEILQVMDRVPLMLLCAFRPERRSLAWEFRIAVDRDFPHRYHEVRLEPLSAEDTEKLAGLLLEKIGSSVEPKRDVAQRAEGNPFYVEEIVRSLQQHGSLAATLFPLPDTLQGVLQTRLDGLPQATRRVLQIASVIGRTFPLRLLATVSGMNGDLVSHLSVLQRTEFLHEQQRLPELQFAFKHVLLQEAAYQTLLREERRDLHRRVAEALEKGSSGAADLPLLVHHFKRGEDWGKAFGYAIKAAEAAQSLSALQAALEQYEIALSIARDHPEHVPDHSPLFPAQKARGDVLAYLGRNREAQRYFEEMLTQYRAPKVRAQIYRSIGHSHSLMGNLRLAQANLGRALRAIRNARDAAAEAVVYRDLAHVMERRRDYARALDYAQRALQIAEEHSLAPQLGDIYYVLAVTHLFGGNFQDAARYAEESLSHALRNKDQLRVVRSRGMLAYIFLLTGNVKDALQQVNEAMALATNLGIGVGLALAQESFAEILLEQGRWEDTARVLESMESVVHHHALGEDWQARVRSQQGFVALTRSLWDEALHLLEQARALEEHTGIARHLPHIYRGLAEAYAGLGDLRRAQSRATKVRTYERGGNPIETPGALRVLAAIAREKGDLPRAIALLKESCALMKGREGCGESARIFLELAKTHAVAGETAPAREAAEESIKIYTALEATRFIEVARGIVTQIGT